MWNQDRVGRRLVLPGKDEEVAALRLLGSFLVLLSLLVVACGRAPAEQGFTGEFHAVTLQSAPLQVREAYDRLKGTPGLYLFTENRETYLLLCAGHTQEAGIAVEVLELKRLSEDGKEVRMLATLKRSPQGTNAPCTAVRVENAANLTFKARVNARDQGVLELQAVPVDL